MSSGNSREPGQTPSVLILETGGLVASTNHSDPAHEAVRRVLATVPQESLVIPALCVAEACYLVHARLGAVAESVFLRSMTAMRVEVPTGPDFVRMADLCFQYRDFPLGGTDASVIALAERLNITTIITLDRRHFLAIRRFHCAAFELLP